MYDCPVHGTNPIVVGMKGNFCEGRLIAYMGSVTACGAVITSGSPKIFVDTPMDIRFPKQSLHAPSTISTNVGYVIRTWMALLFKINHIMPILREKRMPWYAIRIGLERFEKL